MFIFIIFTGKIGLVSWIVSFFFGFKTLIGMKESSSTKPPLELYCTVFGFCYYSKIHKKYSLQLAYPSVGNASSITC